MGFSLGGFFSDQNENKSETSYTDNRANLGQGANLVRDSGTLNINTLDAGAIKAALAGNTKALRRALDFATDSNTKSLSLAEKAMGLVGGAYKDGNGMDESTQKLLIVGLVVVGAVLVMAVRK